jgi:hypothetical protein
MTKRSVIAAGLVASLAIGLTVYSATGSSASTAGSPPTVGVSSAIEAGGSAGDQLTPVITSIVAAPHPALGTDGRVHLAYELLLLNVISSDVTVTGITITGDGKTVQSLGQAAVKGSMKVFGGPMNNVLGAGQQALVWLDVTVANFADAPKVLLHNVSLTVAHPTLPLIPGKLTEKAVARTVVPGAKPVVIGAPLSGKSWLDGNSCCEITAHRQAVNPINGKLWAPERYAIDYVQLDAKNRIFHGPINKLSSYAYFGAAIHAVADGRVVAMVTNEKEQVPGANPVGLQIDQYGGNYIVEDIGGGNFAFYAHLQPNNPLHVKVGQKLKKGAVIGLLGNTGNTDSPHLHFQIMDSPDPLASNGLPFVFDQFGYQGSVVSDANLFDAALNGVPVQINKKGAGTLTKVSPLVRDIMSYKP